MAGWVVVWSLMYIACIVSACFRFIFLCGIMLCILCRPGFCVLFTVIIQYYLATIKGHIGPVRVERIMYSNMPLIL